MRRLVLLLAVALATSALPAVPALRDGHGIHVERTEQLDARQLAVRVSTAALQHPLRRPPSPARYDAAPGRRWPAPAFTQLADASRDGFGLRGTGAATVETPGVYRREAAVRMAMRGPVGTSDGTATVGEDAHATLAVPLGDGVTPGTARVKIRPLTREPAARAFPVAVRAS